MNKSLYTRLLGYTFEHKGIFILSIFGFLLFSAADISAVEWLKQVISYINENNDNPLKIINKQSEIQTPVLDKYLVKVIEINK